jgi:hypothetical protein
MELTETTDISEHELCHEQSCMQVPQRMGWYEILCATTFVRGCTQSCTGMHDLHHGRRKHNLSLDKCVIYVYKGVAVVVNTSSNYSMVLYHMGTIS